MSYTIILVTACLLCAACLIIEGTLNDQLQSNSRYYIINLQKHNTSAAKEFFLVVSSGAVYIAQGIGFVFYVPTQSQIGSLCVTITFISVWLGDLLKMLYAHPRPFWVYSDILGMSCESDFGAPSGHALVVGSIIIYFYVLCFRKSKIISTVIAALLLALIGIDRNYLGVHFYFQVVLGYSIAGLLVCIFMSKKAWKLLEQVKYKRIVIVVIELVIFLASLLIVLVFFVRNAYFDSDWSLNFENQCNDTLKINAVMFESLLESTAIWIVGGFTLGIHLLRRHRKKSWIYYGVSYVIFILIVVAEQIIETYSSSLSYTSKYFIFSIARFLVAFSIAFLSPHLLSLCFPESTDFCAQDI